MNGYDLSKKWFDFCFVNPEKVKPIHTALYFFAVEHCNRLGWKEKFGLPTEMCKEALGVRSWHTYISAFNDIVDWGFFILIERSKNQYSSNIIALSNFDEAIDEAYIKALTKHASKQHQSTHQSNDSINKLVNYITNNYEHIEPRFAKLEKLIHDFVEESDKPPKFDFRKSFLDLGVSEQYLDDWLQVRKDKRSPKTKTAFEGILKHIQESGMTANECIKISAEKGWIGFDVKWLNNQKQIYQSIEHQQPKNPKIVTQTGYNGFKFD